MKRILFTAAAVCLVLAAPAGAQQQWSGPEIGVQGGYGWGTSSGNATGVGGTFPYSTSTTGGLGGVHGGYNFQWGSFVFGLEGDAEGGDISGKSAFAGNAVIKNNVDIAGALRGKLGFAADRFLVYGTGGVAFGDVHTALQTPPGTTLMTPSEWRVGWTAGGGVQYAVSHNWDVGVEYRYTDLGNDRIINTTHAIVLNNAVKYNLIQLALTYRFAPPRAPMAEAPAPAPMPVAAPAPPPPPPPRTFLVFFDFDKATLTADARRVVEAAAASYKATGSARINVAGYTDLAGTQAYNLRLSQRRADAVASYLAAQGVPKSAMDVKWFGKEHPRVPTPDGVREPQNRRVEIMMM